MERAVGVINTFGSGRRIEKVDTVEDTIVFSGITHDEFVRRCLLGNAFVLTSNAGRPRPSPDAKSRMLADMVSFFFTFVLTIT